MSEARPRYTDLSANVYRKGDTAESLPLGGQYAADLGVQGAAPWAPSPAQAATLYGSQQQHNFYGGGGQPQQVPNHIAAQMQQLQLQQQQLQLAAQQLALQQQHAAGTPPPAAVVGGFATRTPQHQQQSQQNSHQQEEARDRRELELAASQLSGQRRGVGVESMTPGQRLRADYAAQGFPAARTPGSAARRPQQEYRESPRPTSPQQHQLHRSSPRARVAAPSPPLSPAADRQSSPQWARATTPPRKSNGPVAAKPRDHENSGPDSFGRSAYVVPTTASARSPTSPTATRTRSPATKTRPGSSSGGGAGGNSTTTAPRAASAVKRSANANPNKPRVGDQGPPERRHISEAERARVRARNQTVPNRQPRTPRLRDSRIRGDFGLPEELPPTRPRVDAATHELREGLHKVTEEMRTLNGRLHELTSTHWDLQQEADRLRREIHEAERDRDDVRRRFEQTCEQLKDDVAALADDVAAKERAVVLAREENERLRRGAMVVSEGAKDRRRMVERSLQADPSFTQPPIMHPQHQPHYHQQQQQQYDPNSSHYRSGSGVGGGGGNQYSSSEYAPIGSAVPGFRQQHEGSSSYHGGGGSGPVMERLPAESGAATHAPQYHDPQNRMNPASRTPYAVGGGGGDGRWR